MPGQQEAVSVGALRRIYDEQPVESPVFQCLQIKQLQSKTAADVVDPVERYRCVFSDINNFIQSMLGTSLNTLVQSEKLKKGSFCRINQFQTQVVKDKKIIVILDCEVLEDLEPCEKLGTPCALEDGGPKENGTSAVKKEEDQKPSGGISSNNFYGNKPQPQAQQQRNLPTRTGGPSSSHGNIYPIEALSPYAHKWTIKARCTHKGDIRTWHKNTGEGKLFSCNFLDESGEIRATAFNDQVDTLHPIIQEGGVYYVSTPCSVKFTNRKFNNLPHEYELTFDRDTVVEKCEDQESAPKVKFNLINIEDIQNVEKDSTIDTIGVLKDVGNTEQITSKTTGKPFDKRDLTIVDETCHSIRLTIWGNTATNFEVPEGSVIAFKGARVSDFNGKSLSLLSSGSMSADPQMDEAYRLKGWYDAQGNSENFKTHAAVLGSTGGGGRSEDYKTVAQVKEEQLGMSESADFFTLKATVMFIHPDRVIAYAACPSPDHNNKVIEDEGQGLWRCERCNRTYPAPQWRYVFGANVSDWTGSFWISCFDDTGKLVFGRDAEHVQKLKEEDEGAYKTLLNEVTNTTLMFKCRAKQDNFQDTVGVRYTVQSSWPVPFAAEANRLADIIKQYHVQDDNSLFVPA